MLSKVAARPEVLINSTGFLAQRLRRRSALFSYHWTWYLTNGSVEASLVGLFYPCKAILCWHLSQKLLQLASPPGQKPSTLQDLTFAVNKTPNETDKLEKPQEAPSAPLTWISLPASTLPTYLLSAAEAKTWNVRKLNPKPFATQLFE